MSAAALAFAVGQRLFQFAADSGADHRPGKESGGKRQGVSLVPAERSERAIERRLRIGRWIAVAINGNSFRDGSIRVARNADIADRGRAGCKIDDYGVAAGNWKSKRDWIGAEHTVDAAVGVDPDGVGVGNDETDEAGTRNALGIKPEHENVATTDETDCADACILRLAHCELGSENADHVTGSSIAVDAGGSRS